RDRLRQISEHSNARLIIYGAGGYGQYLHSLFTEPDWYAFCDKDSNKHGTTYCNLPVISFEELVINHKNDYVVISSPFIYEEVYKELQTAGFPVNQIIFEDVDSAMLADALSMDDSQYFEASIITPQSNEVFIDA